MFPKIKAWDGKDLPKGILTLKLDGVRCHYDGEQWTSRASKPLYNLPSIMHGAGKIYEYFVGDWNSSVSHVRTNDLDPVFHSTLSKCSLYELWPNLDERLVVHSQDRWSADELRLLLKQEKTKSTNFEGFVWWSDDRTKAIKIKVQETWDTEVTGILLGKGKYDSMVGALVTSLGNVGSGLTDHQRYIDWKNPTAGWVGKMIEIKGMGLTKDGKIRHPVFVRLREDK